MQREDTGRRTGRTYRAVAGLPDGGAFIVRNVYQTAEIRDMLAKQGRKADVIHIVPWDPDLLRGHQLKGLRHVAVDHDVWGKLRPSEQDLLRRTLEALHPSIKAA